MNIDGTNVSQITSTGITGGQNNEHMGGACWTPDGKLLYFNGSKLYKINADGSNLIEIATAPSNYWSDVRCSSTGKIAAQTQGATPYAKKIYLMNADGTGLTTLVADDPGNQTLGNFSEDGTLLYYSYDVSGHEESSGLSLNSQIFWITLDGVKKSSLSVNKPAGYNSTTPCSAGSFFEKSAEIWVSNNATGSNVNWQRIVNGLPNFCDRYSIVTNTSSPNELYFGYSVGVPGKKGYGNFEIKKINTANSSTLHIYNIEWYNFYSSPFAGLGYWSTGFELSPSNPNIMFCGGYNLEVLNMSTSNFTFFNVYASPPHPSFHVDQRVFKTATANGKTYLFCGNDGGISRYEYETETMISCNGPGLDNNQYYGIGHAEVDPDFYIGGNQDNGVVGNGSGSFKATVMGDAYEVLVDPITPNICYATANGGSKALVKSIDYFQSVKSYITPSGILGGLNDCPFEISPSDHNTLYVGYNEIYRTINATSNSVTWQKISNFQNPTNPWITTNDMKAIGLAKTDPNQIIVAFTGPTWEGANQSRLFKTTDGGTNWLDLSASLGNTIHWTSITDILVSPVDKNKIWISFAGYWTNGSGNTINKVWYSSNGGSSWVDISNTLPDLPINCMAGIMQNNEYVPMIGNDMGVFKYNATTQTWGNISNGLPHVIVADIETDFTNNMLLVGTYGRGIWKTPIPCDIPVANITVTTSIPWSQNNTIAGTVTIENNATLTITSTISMAEGSKIIVKPGSKLIVDGGTLKNACTGQWQGIEVWGTTNQHQYPINGVYAHGIVELKNGAIIENAANGITNWKPDDWNSIGGIIKAEGATFKNCRRGVEFMKYRNFHPTSGYEMDNVSYFKNCSFIVDDTYPANASPFFTGVSLWSVRGVKVSGCDFFNNKTVKGSGYGIYSLDAGYKVYAICNSQASPCPEQYLDKTWFKGFEYGINASNAETSNSVYIQDSKFTENGYGIELSSVNNAVIIKNRFEMTSATNCPNYGYGINLVNCTGYAIEENLFTVNGVPPANNWSGIETTNSGTAYNEIYKNTFQNLTTGNLADLLNATTNTIPPTGLTYLCNINTNNDYDFYVTNKPESRISYYQRSGTATAAGNSFSQGAVLNFDNGGGSQIRYYYSTGMAPPTYYGVVPVYTANANTCPTHYGGGSGNLAQLNQSQIDALEEQYAENYSAYNNVKSIYETLKDGGSTTNTVEDIETSMPSEMWELRAKLLGDSPHLSQKALTEAALKTDVLPESVLFEILSANPDELRDESFLAFLESKENPLPSYMIDLLRAIAGNTSYKTVLQEQLNAFNTQKALAASDIIRSKLNDSIVSQSDIINWFDNRGDLNSRYQMIDAYIQMGNYTAAQGMLSLIPGLNELSAADSAEYQKVCELKNLQISILNAGRNLAMLTNTEKEQLSVIADANTGIASTQAKGILGFMAGTPYCNCVRYNDELKHSMVKPSTIVNLTSVIKISVAPNPATTWITFEYSLPEKLNSVTLNITDNTGRRIETLTLTGKQGQKVLDTRSYASGAYIYQINQDKKVSGKFIIK